MTAAAVRVGTVIERARVDAGLSKSELGRRLGVSQAAVGLWESGKREPGLTSLAALVRVLRIDPIVLLGVPGEAAGVGS